MLLVLQRRIGSRLRGGLELEVDDVVGGVQHGHVHREPGALGASPLHPCAEVRSGFVEIEMRLGDRSQIGTDLIADIEPKDAAIRFLVVDHVEARAEPPAITEARAGLELPPHDHEALADAARPPAGSALVSVPLVVECRLEAGREHVHAVLVVDRLAESLKDPGVAQSSVRGPVPIEQQEPGVFGPSPQRYVNAGGVLCGCGARRERCQERHRTEGQSARAETFVQGATKHEFQVGSVEGSPDRAPGGAALLGASARRPPSRAVGSPDLPAASRSGIYAAAATGGIGAAPRRTAHGGRRPRGCEDSCRRAYPLYLWTMSRRPRADGPFFICSRPGAPVPGWLGVVGGADRRPRQGTGSTSRP